MRWFIADAAEFERRFNEMAKRDFAWAYMPVPKIRFDGKVVSSVRKKNERSFFLKD